MKSVKLALTIAGALLAIKLVLSLWNFTNSHSLTLSRGTLLIFAVLVLVLLLLGFKSAVESARRMMHGRYKRASFRDGQHWIEHSG